MVFKAYSPDSIKEYPLSRTRGFQTGRGYIPKFGCIEPWGYPTRNKGALHVSTNNGLPFCSRSFCMARCCKSYIGGIQHHYKPESGLPLEGFP